MADIVDTVAAQKETVDSVLRDVFETSSEIASLFKSKTGSVKNISRWLYRYAVKLYNGGSHKKYSANEGSLGKGTGMKTTYLQAGFIYTAIMFRVTDEQADLSSSDRQSVVNVMADTMAAGVTEALVHDDIGVHGDGTGIITNPSSATNGTTTLTFAAASDTLGVRPLHEGMSVDVWTADGSTKRSPATAAPLRIASIDDSTNTVTFDQTVTGLTVGDVIAFYDLDAYGPATLVTGQSGWPATANLTTSGGLTGDSYRHGIRYAHENSLATYYLGKLKSTLPKMNAIEIDCGGNPVTFAHGMVGQDKIRTRYSDQDANALVGIWPMAQRQVIFDLGVTIAEKQLGGTSFGQNLDLAPSNRNLTQTFQYCGLTNYISKRQPNDRVDFINFSNWTRAEVFSLKPYKKGNQTQFEGRSSTGGILAFTEFGWHSAYDYLCYNPGKEFYFVNAEVPEGYATV